jgi:hypothetical protein
VVGALSSQYSAQELASLVQVSLDDGSTDRVAWLSAQAQDTRRSPRQRVLLSALVVDREFKSIFRCQVRNASDQGAGLRIPERSAKEAETSYPPRPPRSARRLVFHSGRRRRTKRAASSPR